MKSYSAALLFAATLGSASAASAATLHPEDVHSFSAPIVLVQQISIPIVINQAIAIGILSQGVTAYAEANVVSENIANIVISGSGGTTSLSGGIDGLDEGLGSLVAAALEQALAREFESNLLSVLLALDELTALLELDLDDLLGGLPAPNPAAPVPVPAALPLASVAFGGLAACGWLRRRRRKIDA